MCAVFPRWAGKSSFVVEDPVFRKKNVFQKKNVFGRNMCFGNALFWKTSWFGGISVLAQIIGLVDKIAV